MRLNLLQKKKIRETREATKERQSVSVSKSIDFVLARRCHSIPYLFLTFNHREYCEIKINVQML